jgi:hypothetical protein
MYAPTWPILRVAGPVIVGALGAVLMTAVTVAAAVAGVPVPVTVSVKVRVAERIPVETAIPLWTGPIP